MPVPTYLLEQKEREIQQALRSLHALPSLTRREISDEDTCPICLVALDTILQEHEALNEKQEGSSYLSFETTSSLRMTGVLKLNTCGHIFCRKDLAEWVESHHGSCPTCRQTFFTFTLIDEAEYESSDGGEYIPEEDDDDYDEFTDGEIDVVASSDLDYDMDEMCSSDEVETDEPEYAPLSQASDGESEESGSRMQRHLSLESSSHLRENFRVYASHGESNEVVAELEVDSREIDDVAGLSYSSDSPSSEEASFNTEDIQSEGICANSISIVLDNDDEGRVMPVDAIHSGTKSTGTHVPGPSDAVRNVVQ